jgi:hypothetical protein
MLPPSSVALALLPLLACGSSGLDTRPRADEVLDSGQERGPVGIERLDPDWGLPDEETAVTLTGHGFSGSVVVAFGRASVNASVVDDETLIVTAPAAGMETTVDVTVTTAEGSAILEDGFTWAHEEPIDTGSGDTGGDTGAETGDTGSNSGAGKVGGLVQFQLLQIACPGCLGYTSNLQVVATAALHTPGTFSWLEWLPAKGTCKSDPTPKAASSSFLDAGSSMWLEYGPDDHPEVSVEMRPDSDRVYTRDGLTADDFVRTAGYRVEVEGGSDVPAFSLTEAFFTPDSISALTPADMLYTEPRQAFAAVIRASRADFTWASSGGAAAFAVVIDVYHPGTGAFLGELFCLDGDTGSMRIPSAELAGFPDGALLVIGMYRYASDNFLRPDDGSTVETLVTFGVLGTGVLSN